MTPMNFNPMTMGYNNPYFQNQNYYAQQNQFQQPIQSQASNLLMKVDGMEDVKTFQTEPNKSYVFFASNEDVFYVKSTDSSNFPTIRKFNFSEEPLNSLSVQANYNQQYVTVDEFNKFKEEILNAQQSIRKQFDNSSTNSKWNNKPANGANKANDENVGKQ